MNTKTEFNWRERLGCIIDHATRIRGEGVRRAVVDLLYEYDALPEADTLTDDQRARQIMADADTETLRRWAKRRPGCLSTKLNRAAASELALREAYTYTPPQPWTHRDDDIPAVLCEHANECPRRCPCPARCYCRKVESAPSCRIANEDARR